MNHLPLTDHQIKATRKRLIEQANGLLDEGSFSTNWTTIEWNGIVARLSPPLPSSTPPKEGQRRYTLFDISNGEFRL